MIRSTVSCVLLPRSAAAAATAPFASLSAAQFQIPRSNKNGYNSAATVPLRKRLQQDEEARNDLAYCLTFSNDESDFARNMQQLFPDARMKMQLRNCTNRARKAYSAQEKHHPIDTLPLPRTLEDALRCQHSRAIVVTEATKPFRIVQVNAAWEGLCEYSFVEAQNKTLGKLLQGPETDALAATRLIAQLLAGQPEAGATLTNYTGTGRRFRNRVRVGPLCDDHRGAVPTHFVGVLQEVNDGM